VDEVVKIGDLANGVLRWTFCAACLSLATVVIFHAARWLARLRMSGFVGRTMTFTARASAPRP
jgi:hypothetical protein